jgi:hypothetical protein
MSAEKIAGYALGEKENTLKKCRFKPPSGAAFGLGDSKYRELSLKCDQPKYGFWYV